MKSKIKRDLIYLACPYSHELKVIREERFKCVSIAAAVLIRAGFKAYSPISHSHPIATFGGLPGDWKYWKSHDEIIMPLCNTLLILKLPGWTESTGIREEIKLAKKYKVRIKYITMTDVERWKQ